MSELEKLKQELEPINKHWESLEKISNGSLEFYDARWIGEGTAKISLDSGLEFRCHKVNGAFEPFDQDFFSLEDYEKLTLQQIQEIKRNMNELILLREQRNQVIAKYSPLLKSNI